jgi:hypothetical protein
MSSHLDPDHWCNGGEHEFLLPIEKAFAEMKEELNLVKRQLRDAMKLLETAESGLIGSKDILWEQRREELENEVGQ